MKNKKMLKLLILISITLLETAKGNFPVPERGRNLSGYWEVNLSKSEFGQLDPAQAVAATIFIYQNDNTLQMQRFFNGKPAVNDTLVMAGKPSIVIDRSGGHIRTSQLLPSKNGLGFIISTKYKDDGSGKIKDFERMETYSISEDGKALVLLRTFTLPTGNITVKAAYDLVDVNIGRQTSYFKPTNDYSGKWNISLEKSNLGLNNVSSVVTNIIIVQGDKNVSIESKFSDESGSTLLLPLDGSKFQRILDRNTKNSYVKFSNKPPKMLVYTDGISRVKSSLQEIYELSTDTQTLTVHRLNLYPIAFTVKTVYEKSK